MGWVVGIILALVAIDLLVRLTFVKVIVPVFEKMPPFGVVPADPDSNAERVEIPTTDGLTLRGSLYVHEDREARGLIIFCPELGGNHWMAMRYCEGLRDAGFDLLAFDFRNQGESDSMPGYSPLHWLTEYEVADALSVIAWSRKRDDLANLPIGLFGVSRGAGAALAAAARSNDVECVAGDSAFSTNALLESHARRWAEMYGPVWLLKLVPFWHIRFTLLLVRLTCQFRKRCRYTILERWLPQLRNKAVYLVAGKRDSYVPPTITEELARRIGSNCRDTWVVARAKHNMARTTEPEEYDRRLVEFFSHMSTNAVTSPVSQAQA